MATYKFPAASKARATGPLNPVAKGLTAPPGVTLLTVPLLLLATYKFPAASKARPSGALNPAANWLTAPPGVTLLTVLLL